MLLYCVITLVLVVAAFAAGYYACTCVQGKCAQNGEVVFKDASGRWIGTPAALVSIWLQMQAEKAGGTDEPTTPKITGKVKGKPTHYGYDE